jgi:hypothetical protein
MERNSDLAILALLAWEVSLRSTCNVLYIGPLMSRGTPSPHTFSLFSVTPRRRNPSAYKPLAP